MVMPAVIEFCGVRYAYPGCGESLHGVDFKIREGGKIALVGPNGAGKTTLMLICIGILRPNEGTVLFHGTPVGYDSKALGDLRKKIGLVFQNSDTQLFAPTVFQDVAFGPFNLGISEADVKDLVRSSLSAVGLAGYERRPPHQLSGGEKKRVAIAGILAMEPEVLIFDEPTSSLDPAGAADLMELLDELNARGKTIIISTHDVELAYHWADEIILMSQGRVFHQGPPGQVFNDRDLINATNLRSPVIVEIFNELVAKKMLEPGNAPGSVLQLVNTLGKMFPASGPHTGNAPGEVTVGNVDILTPVQIHAWIGGNPGRRLGVMGTRAKSLAEQEALLPDFTYGVIDKCILRALTGESSLILTSIGMVERVSRRVREFNVESGIEIRVDTISPS
jgi:cobalt/nickel transport system ATP-binding protein